MKDLPIVITPDRWMVQLFSARAAAEGGVLRRKINDVERLIGRTRFIAEVSRRGFHLIENADQFIVICNRDPLKVLC
jgi:hypothetical protein